MKSKFNKIRAQEPGVSLLKAPITPLTLQKDKMMKGPHLSTKSDLNGSSRNLEVGKNNEFFREHMRNRAMTLSRQASESKGIGARKNIAKYNIV